MTLQKTLDSSLKKNTAFIRKARNGFSAESRKTMLAEVSSLSLEKYLAELIPAIYEGLLRCKTSSDIYCAVEVGVTV